MPTQTLYEITDWNRRYENNRSRLVEKLSWVPIPNAHDGENYSRLMTRKDSAVVFAAWILILQVASRCSPRGSLIRTNGEPHDPESLSLKTRAPASWFNAAIPPLIQYGWLSHKTVDINKVAPERQVDAMLELGDRHPPALEGKRMEGMEEKEGKPDRAAALTDEEWIKNLSTDPAYQGIAVEVEVAKCRRWCETNRRGMSRRRLVNWLNRCEKPMAGGKPSDGTVPWQRPSHEIDHSKGF